MFTGTDSTTLLVHSRGFAVTFPLSHRAMSASSSELDLNPVKMTLTAVTGIRSFGVCCSDGGEGMDTVAGDLLPNSTLTRFCSRFHEYGQSAQ
jgi:hypothetical protein